MRTLVPAVLVFALGCSADDGALLTIRAATGPISATRIEIVLANVDPTAITDVDGQRVKPGASETGPARYYRQRETGGEVEGIARLDGFSVRIAPNTERVPDESFIPFVIAYEGDTITGIGFVAAAGAPAPITVVAGQRISYDVELTPVEPADLAAGIGNGQHAAFECQNGRSGIAWQRGKDDEQLRLLLALDAARPDATERSPDLDCDGHDAVTADCDDLLARYHEDAVEACDGEDVNCDGRERYLSRCSAACGPESGVQLCDDVAGQETQCIADAQCRCDVGGAASCVSCELLHVPSDTMLHDACAPAESKIVIPLCANVECEVSVMPDAQTTWGFSLSSTGDLGTFDRTAVTVQGLLHLQVEQLVAMQLDPAMPALATIHLAIRQGMQTRYHGIALRLSPTESDECIPQPSTLHAMRCSGGN